MDNGIALRMRDEPVKVHEQASAAARGQAHTVWPLPEDKEKRLREDARTHSCQLPEQVLAQDGVGRPKEQRTRRWEFCEGVWSQRRKNWAGNAHALVASLTPTASTSNTTTSERFATHTS